ncbi:MAG: DUF2076 domain-containing protein, partial [Acetobacteraceae bacterium]|nr:DUF2076 domain-containing protein [Acetobacteraceae bacterium]
MTSEERDLITRFIERISGAQGTPGFGSAPGAAQPLPPIDKDADALIGELFQKYPEARYRLTQYAFVQEQALAAAQSRMKQLEQELQQARQAAQEAPRRSGGFFSNLFGGGSQPSQPGSAWGGAQRYQGPPQQPPAAYPQPQYAPGYQPGMFQPSGTGFLGSALRTAAGVAGGVVLGNALMDMFSSHSAHAAGLGGAGLGEAGLGGAAGAAGAAAGPWGAPGG